MIFSFTKKCTILSLLFSFVISAQNSFQKASYIDSKGLKTEGFIYNSDWESNPSSIEFKPSLEAASKTITIDNIQEFEIAGVCKYVKFEGLIDQSLSNLNDLDSNRNPSWKFSVVLLKVLLESDASLYYYSNSLMQRYFYSVASKNIKTQQLVYKEYFKNGDRAAPAANFEFRQQLLSNLVCDGLTKSNVSSLKYNSQNLIRFFTIYNNCKNISQLSFVAVKKNMKIINYSVLVAGSNIAFETKSNTIYTNKNQLNQFESALCYKLGGEIEWVLPINNEKWAIYTQPVFQSFNADNEKAGIYGPLLYSIDYKSLNLPIGLRYYMFLNPKSKIYLNAAFGYVFDLNSKVVLGNDKNFTFSRSSMSAAFGLGYVLNDKFCFEMRYNFLTDVINEIAFSSNVQDLGLIFRYKLN